MSDEDAYELAEVHCVGCGRFLGKARLEAGELYLKCPRCKNWTAVLDPDLHGRLTGEEIASRINDRKAVKAP